mmetsp:Transcript_19506/g.45431  ORF Transcript_19506/g.45431 Transcript_19506/m.45431 type:complete len:138 (-) Transcript_19506:451-864(-)
MSQANHLREITPAYTQVWQPTERCVAVDLGEPPPTACEEKGGECKHRCDPSVSRCLEELCKPNVDLEVLEDTPPSDVDYLEGCYCAIPIPTEPPTPTEPPVPPPTPPPTPCPPTDGPSVIAGYLARTDTKECVSVPL